MRQDPQIGSAPAMAVGYDKLLNFPISKMRQLPTKRDSVLYALSIGLAQDPIDERQLDFVEPHRALKPMPSMAVVLGHPGFWLAHPDTGVDSVRLVHSERSISLLRALPAEGKMIGRTRVTGLIDKGEGKGALLYSEKQVVKAASGEVLAMTSSTTFLRGYGGFGGPEGPVRSPAPEGEPDITIDLPTRPEQALYYRTNVDDNPRHADHEVAAKAGFSLPILHGLCTFGIVCHALVRGLGDHDPARLREMRLRFSAPVLAGETIRTEIWRNGGFRARVVERDQLVVTNGLAVLAD